MASIIRRSVTHILRLHCHAATFSKIAKVTRVVGVLSERNPINFQREPTWTSVAARNYSQINKEEVSFDELQALIKSSDVQLIDVREPKELQEYGQIPGAVNVPLSLLTGALHMTDEAFLEHYKCEKPQSYDSNIVFYGLGSIKSTAAVELAWKYGFPKARHYKGGWEDYSKRTGQPLKKNTA